MGVPARRPAPDADPHQGEKLSTFLQRINFSLDSAGGSPQNPPAASLNGAVSGYITSGSAKSQPLHDCTNGVSRKPDSTIQLGSSTSDPCDNPQKIATTVDNPKHQVPPSLRSSLDRDSETISTEKRATTLTSALSKRSEKQALQQAGQPPNRSHKPRHELPVYALAQTLRASSIGATMAPGFPSDASGLGWSKYAPSNHSDQSSSGGLNQRTSDNIARQAEIDARLSKLRSRRGPGAETQEEAKEKKQSEEAARLDAERLKQEIAEAKRMQREKEEAERIEREKKEAERIEREKKEAERIQREREEAKRIQREKEEAERIQREKEEAERLQRLREEAEEAALRATLYERIDAVEEDGLSKTEAMQLELQRMIEESTVRHDQIINDVNTKRDEVIRAQEALKHLQDEMHELERAKDSVTAKLETATKKCAELQTFSEAIIDRAAKMRKEVEDKALRSLGMIEAFEVPQTSARDALLQLFQKPNGSITESPKQPTGSQQPGTKVEHEDSTSDSAKDKNASHDGAAHSKTGPVENGMVKKPVLSEPAASSSKKNSNKIPENTVKFDKWPAQEIRPFGGAQKRLVKLSNLPVSSHVSDVPFLVWGGRIEKIEYVPGNCYAWVLFMRGQDCEKYFVDTANGIQHPDEESRTVWVEMGDPVTVNETLRGMYEAGHTRCVRAVGADSDWGQQALRKLASAKNRKVDRIVNGANPKGLRVIEFRFANIVDATRFKVELQNDIDWEHCNVYFGDDPCELNTGVHHS